MKNISELLNERAGQVGLGTLADRLGVDPAALSRFRSDQGALSLKKIDLLVEDAEVVIVPRAELKRMEEALEVISDLWKQEKRRNSQCSK